jgi:hypothetical protein
LDIFEKGKGKGAANSSNGANSNAQQAAKPAVPTKAQYKALRRAALANNQPPPPPLTKAERKAQLKQAARVARERQQSGQQLHKRKQEHQPQQGSSKKQKRNPDLSSSYPSEEEDRYWEHEQRSDDSDDDDCEHSNAVFPSDTKIVQRVLDFVGAGQHAYMAPVCSLWRECYARVPEHQQTSPGLTGIGTATIAVRGTTTLCSAAFASMKRFRQVMKSGLELGRDRFQSTTSMGLIFGRAATDEMLEVAQDKYGIRLTDHM